MLVRQDKVNKFSTTFNPTPCVVVRKSGNSLIVESPDGVQYSRNSSHVRKHVTASSNRDVGTAAGTNNETPTTRPESPDGSASRSADTQPIVTEGPTPPSCHNAASCSVSGRETTASEKDAHQAGRLCDIDVAK